MQKYWSKLKILIVIGNGGKFDAYMHHKLKGSFFLRADFCLQFPKKKVWSSTRLISNCHF